MAEFRLATASDCDLIAQMEQSYIECAWSKQVIAQTLADELSAIYLLTEGDIVVGYGGIKTVLDEAEIYNVAVVSEYRRQGYGGKIVNKLVEHAAGKGAKKIFLEVSERNEPAVKLYGNCGFTKINERKNYYQSGNALILLKTV